MDNNDNSNILSKFASDPRNIRHVLHVAYASTLQEDLHALYSWTAIQQRKMQRCSFCVQ